MVNGKTHWLIHRTLDLLFDRLYNERRAWPQGKLFTEDLLHYGPAAFRHEAIQAYTDEPTALKALQTAIAGTPEHLRYNLPDPTAPGYQKTEEHREALSISATEWTYINNGKKTRKVKKDDPVPEGWTLGNLNLQRTKKKNANT